jgi:uncharacterized protein YecT (DUF1311 family)
LAKPFSVSPSDTATATSLRVRHPSYWKTYWKSLDIQAPRLSDKLQTDQAAWINPRNRISAHIDIRIQAPFNSYGQSHGVACH